MKYINNLFTDKNATLITNYGFAIVIILIITLVFINLI